MNTVKAPGISHGIDISRFTGPVYYKDWMKVRNRFDIAVVGSWHGTMINKSAALSLDDAAAAGYDLGTYIVLNHMDGRESVEKGLNACGNQVHNLKFVALDIELDEAQGIELKNISTALEYLKSLSISACIYTGRWFWDGHLGNPKWFKNIPLWDSYYDGKPKLELVRSYGGWTKEQLIGKQYYGTKHHENIGFSCDLSVFKRDWWRN